MSKSTLAEVLDELEKAIRAVARAQWSGLPFPVAAGNLVAARSRVELLFEERTLTPDQAAALDDVLVTGGYSGETSRAIRAKLKSISKSVGA